MKAGVVGVGKLGAVVAYAIARLDHFDEIVLCDAVEGLAWAQAEDIRHGLDGKSKTVVRAGEIKDLAGLDVVVLSAGQGRKPGMTRLDLLHANTGLVTELGRELPRAAPNAALVVLTNPVDVMTTLAWQASGLPREKVLGSGALVDSMRLRAILADRLGMRPYDVDATVLGEHGDRAVPIFSRIQVHGKPLDLTTQEKREVQEQLRTIAARIIEVKGGTAFGPAGCTSTLVDAVVSQTPSVVPASVVLAGEYGLRDIAVGVPAVVGQGRVIRIEEWPLRSDEQSALQDAGQDLAKFVEDAAVVQGLAVRHTTLEKFAASSVR